MDIHKIFWECCEKLNIEYKFCEKSKTTNIYKKKCVDKLLLLFGDKNNIIWK